MLVYIHFSFPGMKSGATTHSCMHTSSRALQREAAVLSLCLSAQRLSLPHPEGHGGRGMETEEKIVIRGRAQSSAERQKHLCVLQTFYTHCTQSQQLCNTGSTDEKLICMQQLEVYRAVLVCHCDWCSPGRFQQCLKIILEAYRPAWPRVGRRKRSIHRATAVI